MGLRSSKVCQALTQRRHQHLEDEDPLAYLEYERQSAASARSLSNASAVNLLLEDAKAKDERGELVEDSFCQRQRDSSPSPTRSSTEPAEEADPEGPQEAERAAHALHAGVKHRTPFPDSPLLLGDSVVVQGLVAQVELNGLQGWVVSVQGDRFGVELFNGRKAAIKPPNLVLVSESPTKRKKGYGQPLAQPMSYHHGYR